MWLEHLLFGARFDTRLRGEFTRSVSPVQFSLFEIYGVHDRNVESSLTSLRKDNEVKLEDEIN